MWYDNILIYCLKIKKSILSKRAFVGVGPFNLFVCFVRFVCFVVK